MTEEQEFYFVSHGPEDDPFWTAVNRGIETASSLYGVQSRYIAPETYEGDPGALLRDLLETESPDGLAITLTDPVGMEGIVRRAIEREGIPVVVVNVPDHRDESERIPYEHYVGMDERACGERLAQATIDRSESVDRALVVVHEPGHKGLERRVSGLQYVLDEHDIPLRVVESNDQDAIVDAIVEDRNSATAADTYFSLGPHATDPMFEHFRRQQLLDDLTFSVTDGLVSLDSPEEYIRRGKLTCSVEQDPFLQGFLPISKLYDLTTSPQSGSAGPQRYLMGPDVVDKYSIDKEIQNQIIRDELIGSLEQLDNSEKEALVGKINNKFSQHQGIAVVSAQVVTTLLPHLL